MPPLRSALIALTIALAAFALWQRHLPRVASGWAAKRLCTAVFVSGRLPHEVVEVALPIPIPLPTPTEIDRSARKVTARFLGRFAPSTAQFRPGLGCTLDDPLGRPARLDTVRLTLPDAAPRPLPALPPSPALEAAVASAFSAEAAPGSGTRAVVVLHEGALAAEAYAEGFGPDTPLAGWSMTKSVTSTMIGMLVEAGRIDPLAPLALEDWPPGDPRTAITWDQLLRMSSGLAFDERYTRPGSDVIQMLFGSERASRGRYAAHQGIQYPPGTHWSYSSGTTNLLQYALLTKVFDDDLEAYLRFPHEQLFGPLGMASAILEPDASGVYVGSSHLFATARDWARFGQLYLDGGRVGDRRLLDTAWIEYSTRPTPTEPGGTYGAHWWLNAEPHEGERRWPLLDRDVFAATGFEGQFVVVVPDRDVVVVRLGLDAGSPFDIESLVARILDALGPGSESAG